MVGSQRLLVGVHFRRHFGGPGHLTIEPGVLTLTNRKGSRSIRHTAPTLSLERKRFEPKITNHWLALTDGEVTGWATMSRTRADEVVAAIEAAGFQVEQA